MDGIYSFKIKVYGRTMRPFIDERKEYSSMSLAFLEQMDYRKNEKLVLLKNSRNEMIIGKFKNFSFTAKNIAMKYPVYITKEDRIPCILFGKDWLLHLSTQYFKSNHHLSCFYHNKEYIQLPTYNLEPNYDFDNSDSEDEFEEQQEDVLEENETKIFSGFAKTEYGGVVATKGSSLDFHDDNNSISSSCKDSLFSTDNFELNDELFQQNFSQQEDYLKKRLKEISDATVHNYEEKFECDTINDNECHENFKNDFRSSELDNSTEEIAEEGFLINLNEEKLFEELESYYSGSEIETEEFSPILILGKIFDLRNTLMIDRRIYTPMMKLKKSYYKLKVKTAIVKNAKK